VPTVTRLKRTIQGPLTAQRRKYSGSIIRILINATVNKKSGNVLFFEEDQGPVSTI